MFTIPLNETEYVYYSFKISARYVKNKWNKAEYIFTVKYNVLDSLSCVWMLRIEIYSIIKIYSHTKINI